MSPPVLVVAAALVDDLDLPRRLLAARRRRPAALAGRWEFPGGKVDDGESPEQALHREIAEELGVGIVLGAPVPAPGGGDWPISERYALRLWSAVVLDGVPAPLVEHDALRWLGPDAWLAVPWLDADLPIVTALARQARSPAGLR
ncbi:NUDIX domain-containing protein [Actinotalea sp.]|uniref:NUDIX domain-containing protein n=1 Tax=Actinotalea sp. TaxID=1872145 RepID=UPI002BBAB341|nr:NUDIX domain-containing protein [Actinotalea sp.]HQY32426.1 NUDIX domain-containing protein [Actinotalea sp.]HRA49549.1 NUDIX domain-containing protein [Actinotalea sp.]